MALRRIFPSMYTLPDTAPAQSRNATRYLLRCIFLMGIRTPPKGNRFLVYILWSFVLNLCSTFYQPFGFMVGYISHIAELSPGELLTSLQVAVNALSCSIKVVIVWMLAKRFDQANLTLDEMDKRVLQPSERGKVHRAVSISNRILLSYMTVYMFCVTCLFLSGLVMGVPMFQNYYPGLNWRAGRLQFWVQSFLEYLSLLGASFQNVCVDCYPINYVLILRAHLTNFAERLRKLGQDADETAEQRYEKLVECIQDHKVMLRCCDTLRPVISGTIFVQLLVVGLVLGLTLINIVLFANFGSRIAALTFLTAVLLETTPFCILCNYLADDCLKLADALFESNWIYQDQRYKKAMLQFLQRLQKPIVFMAGNIFTISVATNLNVSLSEGTVKKWKIFRRNTAYLYFLVATYEIFLIFVRSEAFNYFIIKILQATKFSFSVFTLVKQMNIAEKLARPKEVE